MLKIISGGQTGADQAGLIAAGRVGLPTGGHMPKGFRTQRGPAPKIAALYGLKEDDSSDYPPRTRLNVKNSDATLIFGNVKSRGCSLTKRLCVEYEKEVLIIPRGLEGKQPRYWINMIASFIVTHEVKVLNIAGNREESDPGICRWTAWLLVRVFQEIKSKKQRK